MGTAIRKIGNSAGLILPKPVLEALGAKLGDDVEFVTEGSAVRIELRPRKVREGWEESAKAIAAAGLTEEERQWLDAPLSDDDEWAWDGKW